MRYANFDLWIDSEVGDRYPLRAASPSGEVRGALALDARWRQLQEFERRLAERQVDQSGLIDFGRELYHWVFEGDIGRLFERSAGQSWQARSEHGLRVRLRIEAPELIVFPWEFLYCPHRERFLGASIQCPVVRYLELFEPIEQLEVALPLKMLVAIPRAAELDAAREKADLTQTLAGLEGRIALTVLDGTVTFDRISDALLEQSFQLFHFIGHGEFRGESALLQLNAGDGGADWVDGRRIADLFANHPSLKLVFLNSCKGAETSHTTPLAGMAHQLVKRGIPAVVAMQYAIYDDAAILFSREFYRSLFKGRARGRVEFAVSHARSRLLGEFPGERDSGAPVLFMRASEGLLFDMAAGTPLAGLALSSGEYHRSAAARETYQGNIEQLKLKYQAAPDPEVAAALARNATGLSRLERALGFRRIVFVAACSTSLLVFFLFWIGLFDFLPPVVRIESYAVWLAGAFASRPADERVAIVTIDAQTEQAIGKAFGRDWRREHAIVLERLSRAGAKVVAFDLYFEEPTAFDREFAGAVERATRRHTAVIAGFRSLDNGRPKVLQALREAGARAGLLCVGKRWGSSQVAPLAVMRQDPPQVFYSLALEAGAAFQEREIAFEPNLREVGFFDPATRQITGRVAVSEFESVRWEQAGCPAIGKYDRIASILLDPASLAEPEARRWNYRYESVIKDSDAELASRFKGKIALVGVERKDDLFPVLHGLSATERYGIELHAIAIQSLLANAVIKPLGNARQFLVMMVMALLGASLRLKRPRRSLARTGLLGVISLGYLGLASYVFQAYFIVLNMAYHVLAFAVSYWTVGKIQRRWFQ